MRRLRPATWLLLLAEAVLLVTWLVLGQATFRRVHALQVHSIGSLSPNTARLALATNEIRPSKTEARDHASTDDLNNIVAVPPKRGLESRQRDLENVVGPELGPGLTPGVVLENMRSVIRDYGARFGGNPIGNNREITARLNGANAKQVVFLKEEDGMRINARGELTDNWGTPFFFHQVSGTEMEIRSAGPDMKMWTADDLVMK